ncbi:unnamed protein product [Urochloa decumbens]|uniref:Uncharacterized protein n=1 Tax=Urochloa decumbens TaxID=240449 RepID=A0ABC9FYJ9_9POAL
MAMAAKSWRLTAPVAVLMVAAIFACFCSCAVAAEMAPSPSPDSAPSVELDEETSLNLRLLDLKGIDLNLTGSELVGLQKYMDRLEASIGGGGFRFEKTAWDLSPGELGFKLGVIFAQAAFRCTITTPASGDPSRPTPQIPLFIREKLHLHLSGITVTHLP